MTDNNKIKPLKSRKADAQEQKKSAAKALDLRRSVEDKLEEMRLRKLSAEFDYDFS